MTAALAALSILVADDEEGIRSLLVHWLERHGHAVATVGSAQQATRLLEQQCFDLVITDVVMPTATALSSSPHSGGGKYLEGTDCLRIARGLGAHAAVMKPFNWEQLQIGIELAFAQPSETPPQQ